MVLCRILSLKKGWRIITNGTLLFTHSFSETNVGAMKGAKAIKNLMDLRSKLPRQVCISHRCGFFNGRV
jgi:hypothetical protein